MWKSIKLHLVRTDHISPIWSYKGRKIRVHHPNFNDHDDTEYYYLIATSDEKINQKEWYFNTDVRITLYGVLIADSERLARLATNAPSCRKIIAATIGLFEDLVFPTFDDDFLQYYIDEYNKGNIISEVSADFKARTDFINMEDALDGEAWELNVDDENNIIIKTIKTSWTRDEIIDIIKYRLPSSIFKEDNEALKDQWITENL